VQPSPSTAAIAGPGRSPAPGSDLPRVIGFWGGLALIVGITIGSGVFRKPYTLARDVGNAEAILALWVFFGLVSLCGALALAELASMMPQTGGAYVYLRAAYGDSAAFVFGWLYLLVTTPATIGALGTFFAELLLGLAGIDPRAAGPWAIPLTASVTILALTVVNLLGARLGSAVQGVLTVVKVGALLVLMLVSFTMPGGSFSHLASGGTASSLGKGAASVIWAYDGWIAVSMIAGEVRAPERQMRRVIVVGMLAIVLLYVGANVGYFFVMPVEVMAERAGGVPQRIMADRLGPMGATFIAAAILCSVFGALNGNVLAKPRVAYALARDGLTFSFLGRPHPRWSTPHAALLIQAAVALVLVALLRDFDRLTTYFVVVEWFALLFAVGAVLVLRRLRPDAPRPFRTPGYPLVPLVFLAGTVIGLVAIVWGEIDQPTPNYAPVLGLLLALAGFPVYALWRRRAAPALAAPALAWPALGESFRALSAPQRRAVHEELAERALQTWEAYARSRAPITYQESVVGTAQVVELDLPARALAAVRSGQDVTAIEQRYREPITALQDMDLELPDPVGFAYYAVYNLFRRYALQEPIEDGLILDQACSSLPDEQEGMALLAGAIARARQADGGQG
jgi:APA family basic amino acid/polyamine antiporter